MTRTLPCAGDSLRIPQCSGNRVGRTRDRNQMPRANSRTSVPSDPVPLPEEENRHQLRANRAANGERMIFENRGGSSTAEYRCVLEEPIPSSPWILEHINAALDEALHEALDKNAIVPLEPVKDDVPPPVTPPLTTRTNQSASTRRNGTLPRRSRQRKDKLQHKPASSSLTRENGWFSVDVLAHTRTEELDVGALLPKEDGSPRPAPLSERARGELPTAGDHSTRVFSGQIVVPPYRVPAALRPWLMA